MYIFSVKHAILLIVAIHTATGRISVMYAHERLSDLVAHKCLDEMFPKARQADIQESDEACIIFCVLHKFGIISSNGAINLDTYRKHVQTSHQLGLGPVMTDYGSTCLETAEVIQHKQDVCKKAKAFNDCTHLYRIIL